MTTRQAFNRWVFGLALLYAAFVLALNHFMIVEDYRTLRTVFYLFVGVYPFALLGAWRSIERVHKGEPKDIGYESDAPFLFGVALAVVIGVISSKVYGPS